MTQVEAEFVAREIRNRCLHSSWNDLVAFWHDVMGNLESAYCVATQNTADIHRTSSGQFDAMHSAVRDKLAEVLSQLVGEKQEFEWCAEVTDGN